VKRIPLRDGVFSSCRMLNVSGSCPQDPLPALEEREEGSLSFFMFSSLCIVRKEGGTVVKARGARRGLVERRYMFAEGRTGVGILAEW